MKSNKSKKVTWAKKLISSTTDSVKDTSYDEVVDYLEYIVKKYDTILHNITGKKINDIKKILEKFARVQDSIYSRKYKASGNSNLSDDLFEVILATINKDLFSSGDYRDDVKRNTIMHDAWTLGKMFIISNDNVIIRQSTDNGLPFDNKNTIKLTRKNFGNHVKKYEENKEEQFQITLGSNETFTFLGKRLYQLRHFENLSFDQQNLDNPPQFTYIVVMSPKDQEQVLEFIKPSIGGGSMKDSGKRIIIPGTSGKRILYVDNRGDKYIKKNGKYIPINKN